MTSNYMQLNLSKPAALNASAGTGKTYSLVRLVILYLLQKDHPPKLKELLLVTYTNKATAELKQRLRQLLRSLIYDQAAFEAFLSEHQPYLITQGYDKNSLSHQKLIQSRLDDAYMQLDEAAVYTIHSFCQHILRTFPFESNQNFQFKLINDQELLKEMLYDFFRQYQATGLPARLDLGFRCYTKKLKAWGKDLFSQLIDNKTQGGDFTSTHNETSLLEMLKNDLQYTQIEPSGTEAEAIWQCYVDFNQQQGPIFEAFKPLMCAHLSADESKFKALQQLFLSNQQATPSLMHILTQLIDHFSAHNKTWRVEDSNLKQRAAPAANSCFDDHLAFFLSILNAHKLYDPSYHKEAKHHFNFFFAAMKADFLRDIVSYLQANLTRSRQVQGRMRFNDLIDDLYSVLQNEKDSAKLIHAVRKTFRIALIDEFQDTDSKQWDIFYKFFKPDATEKLYHSYLLIGDPKQSIYRFRGANLQSYYQALRTVDPDNICTLKTNYRSHAQVLQAINQLFGHIFHGDYCQINTYEALKAGNPEVPILAKHNKALGGLTFLGIESENESQLASNKELISEQAHLLTLKTVLSLLNDSSYQLIYSDFSQAKPIEPQHIACLVETNDDARQLKELFDQYNVPAVLLSDAKVTASQEFILIQLLLKALITTHDQEDCLMHLFQSIYLKPFFKLHQQNFEIFIKHIHLAKALYKKHGIHIAVEFLLHHLCIHEGQLATNRGERYFVNIRHVQEILVQLSLQTGQFSIENMLIALEQLAKTEETIDTLSLRLERDGDAIQILTGHKSKGLEFPIVISQIGIQAPKDIKQTAKALEYQSQQQAGLAYLAFYPTVQDVLTKYNQEKEEKIRLFYVALTRAQSHLFVPLICSEKESYLQDFMLQAMQVDRAHLNQLLSEKKQTLKDKAKIRHTQLTQALKQLTITSPIIRYQTYESCDFNQLSSYQPPHSQAAALSTLIEPPHLSSINLAKRVDENSSYSSLARALNKTLNSHEEPTIQDLEEQLVATESISALNIRGGAGLGSLLHKLLEKIDFAQANQPLANFLSNSALSELVATQAQEFFNHRWTENSAHILVLKELIWHSLNKPLHPLHLQLKNLPTKQCRHEVAFRLYLKQPLSITLINQTFSLNQGYLIGFIDMLFEFENKLYILDWKSSLLGQKEESYLPKNLEQTMQDQHFTLQYHLYLLAAIHYAKLTNPHFSYEDMGGIFYIFNRGMTLPHPQAGIYFTRPSKQEFLAFTAQFEDSLIINI